MRVFRLGLVRVMLIAAIAVASFVSAGEATLPDVHYDHSESSASAAAAVGLDAGPGQHAPVPEGHAHVCHCVHAHVPGLPATHLPALTIPTTNLIESLPPTPALTRTASPPFQPPRA